MIEVTELLPVFAQIDMLIKGRHCGNCLHWRSTPRGGDKQCRHGKQPYDADDYCFDWKARLDSPKEAA